MKSPFLFTALKVLLLRRGNLTHINSGTCGGETCCLLKTVADCQLSVEEDFQRLKRIEILLKQKSVVFSMTPFIIVVRAIFHVTEGEKIME